MQKFLLTILFAVSMAGVVKAQGAADAKPGKDEEVKKEIEEGKEDAVVTRLRAHLDANQSKRTPSS